MTDRWLRLSGPEFFLCWDAANLGEPPAALAIPHVGATRADRNKLAEQASPDLKARGLGTIRDPSQDLAELLDALANRGLSLTLVSEWSTARLTALAVDGPSGPAIVATSGPNVAVRAVRRSALVPALVDELEPLPAGPGVNANVAWPDYVRACQEGECDGVDGFLWTLHDTGVRTSEARTIVRAVADRTGAGQLVIGTRAEHMVDSIDWVDTEEGRYVLRKRGTWLSVIPTNPAKLAQLVTESLPV